MESKALKIAICFSKHCYLDRLHVTDIGAMPKKTSLIAYIASLFRRQEAAWQRCSLSCPSSYKQPSSDKCEGRPLPFYKTRLCRPCPAGHRRACPVVFYWDWFNRSLSEPESETPSQSRWHRLVTVTVGPNRVLTCDCPMVIMPAARHQ